MITIEEAQELAKTTLSPKRYEHTLAVVRLSGELAEVYGIDTQKARLAAMLHDITKEKSSDWQLQRLTSSGIIDETLLIGGIGIYHGITAYLAAKEEYGISDSDLLNAIRYHSTGRNGMSLLEKIIFTADTVAYDRTYKDAQRLRELSFTRLDDTVFEICRFIISDLTSKLMPVCPDTLYCYNTYAYNR